MPEFCLAEQNGHILTVTLNRPEKMNALHSLAHFELDEIFNDFDPDEIAIAPLRFDHAYWCKRSGAMASSRSGPATSADERIFLSGTKLREMLERGECPPEEFTRSEIARILIEYHAQQRHSEQTSTP